MRVFIKNCKIILINKLFKVMLLKEWNNIMKSKNDVLDILTFSKSFSTSIFKNPKFELSLIEVK